MPYIFRALEGTLFGDKNKFKLALKRYLLHNSFYSLKDYFNTQLTMILILFRLLLTLFLIIVLIINRYRSYHMILHQGTTYAECTLALFVVLNVYMTGSASVYGQWNVK